jgi:hypothetical protein
VALKTSGCCFGSTDQNWKLTVSTAEQPPADFFAWVGSIFCSVYNYVGNLGGGYAIETYSKRQSSVGGRFPGYSASYSTKGWDLFAFLGGLAWGALTLAAETVQASYKQASAFADEVIAFGSALDTLWTAMKDLVGDGFQTILEALVDRPKVVVANILQGTRKGVIDFFNPAEALLDNIQGILGDWARACRQPLKNYRIQSLQ